MSSRDAIVNILPLAASVADDKKGCVVSASEVNPNMSPRPLNARTFSGRRKVSQEVTKGQEQHHFGYDGEEDTASRLGQFYMKVVNFNVITRNAVYILPVAALLAIPLAIFATTASESRAGGIRLCGLFIWLEIV
ncbi:hypothetical protein LTR16_006404, partial [Cryomyces antarcticus]